MISIHSLNFTGMLGVAVISLLSSCGGGGGTASGEGGFTNTKPQSSSESSSSSVNSSSSARISSSLTSVTSSSRVSTPIIDTQAPTPSAKLSSEIVLSDRVTLAWTPAIDNVGTAFYKIYRDDFQIDTVYASDTIYYDFDVAGGKTYTYSVSAGDASGNWSAPTSLTLNTPELIVVSSSSQASSVNSSISSSQASSVNSSISSSQASSVNSSISSSQASSVNSSISSSQASSVNSSISSSQASSASDSSSQSSTIPDTTIPTQPIQLIKVNAFSTQIDISWSTATDNIGVTSYKIYRDGLLLSTVSSSIQNYSDKTVAANMSYWYGVSAGDAAGNWSSQKLLNISTPSPIASGSITLKWLPPSQRENGAVLSSSEIGGYEIRYRTITENTYKYFSVASDQTQIALSNLTGDYIFEIAVFDTNGLYSNFVTITPQ